MNKTSLLNAIAYCLFPLLLYYVVYEAAVYVLYLVVQMVPSSGWVRAALWTASHAGDVSALVGAVAMAAGFLAIHKTAEQEAPLTRRAQMQRQREEEMTKAAGDVGAAGEDAKADTGGDPSGQDRGSLRPAGTAAAVLLALSSSLFLNLIISMSGASSSDAGAASAAAQTAAVSLPLGLLYYGILSPFIEETVFRGITFGRIRSVLRAAGAEGDPERRYFLGAALLSSLLFGIYHGNVVQGFYAFCMGLIFCVFRERTGSLAAAALLHGAVNAMTLLLSQSGLYAQLGTPAWLAAFLAIAACSGIFLAGQS